MKWRLVGFLMVVVVVFVLRADRYPTPRVTGFIGGSPILVAKQPIPKGTPGSLMVRQVMYAPTTLPPKDIEVGAVSDPQ